jgi:aldose 1-epimerase
MDHLYRNVIVYMPIDFPYIAVEPVTNTNDGFNMLGHGIADHHVFVLQPGEGREAMSGYVLEAINSAE